MAVSEKKINYLLLQLSEFGGVTVKKMFGGVGLFKDNTMFGMVDGKETFRMRVDESNQPDYESAGMGQFPSRNGKRGMPYWVVPQEIISDKKVLNTWAEKAYNVALQSKGK